MSEDKLDFIDEKAAEVAETPAAPVVEAAPEAKGDEPAAPPAASEEKPSQIPISALLDERERRQKAEREAEELRQYRRRIEETQRQAAMRAPDLLEHPDQRMQYERQQIESALIGQKLQQSRFIAEREFGAEEVAAAYAWFDQHPQLSHQLLAHPSPFHAAVEFYRRQKIADEVGSDPEAWRTKERERIRAELLAEIQPAQQTQTRLPGSLAAAPAAGRAGEPRPRGSAFDAAFSG